MAAAAVSPDSEFVAPESYAEFYRRYEGYVRAQAFVNGVPPAEVDDFVSEIVTAFIERDGLGRYDCTLAPFQAYLWGFVAKRCMSWRRASVQYANRHVSLDSPSFIGDEEMPGLEAQIEGDDEEAAAARRRASTARLKEFQSRVAECAGRRLADLVGYLLWEIFQEDEVNRKRVAKKMGVSSSLLEDLIKQLRGYALEFGLV